jgi:hypothetical protein
MDLTFLEATQRITKTYNKRSDGSIEKNPYPNIYEVTSIAEQCQDLSDLETYLKKHAVQGHCLLKSNPSRALVKESRAGTTDTNAPTEWLVFDIDGIPNVKDPDQVMSALGLEHVSYVVQYSASYKIENDDLRCHLFVFLDKPVGAPVIKQWLIHKNHTVSLFRDAMSLTRTGNTISWPLDITACQNDKLIYIAPPTLGKGIPDPFKKGGRIKYARKQHDTFKFTETNVSAQKNREQTAQAINQLREKAGLPPRKTQYKVVGNMEVLVKPDVSVISDMKSERGYVYFNLNGGDSWAYYHPEDRPDYIYNFKSEPVYVTKELLPEYWEQLTSQAVRTSSTGITYLAFCDRRTGAYWRGTYDASLDSLDIYIAKNETQVRHFAKQHGMPLGDYIPEWDLTFDPHDTVRVDIENRTVNTFEPTVFMKAVPKKQAKCPQTIFRVIHHALGSDPDITEHFINWIAFILQYRDRAKTAWVMHGTTGTGKGILANKILRPLFGANQTAMRRMEEFNEQYNGFMEKCFVVFVDEVQTKALVNERGVMAKLKNFITEESITIREMYRGSHEVRNYSNWIFASNMTDPVAIDKEDRRFNVGKYQPEKLADLEEIQTKILPAIEKELQAFHDFLVTYPVDVAAAATAMDTEDRQNMISISESSVDTVGSAILEGNFEFFVDQLPTTNAYVHNAMEANRVENYRDVLKSLLDRMDAADGKCNISRDELRTIFEYTVGNIPTTPNKFTSLMKHHRIHSTKVWVDGKAVYGIKTHFKDFADIAKFREYLTPKTSTKLAKKV